MARGAKGFKKLVGVTITKVDDACVNSVVLADAEGNTYTISVEIVSIGVERLSLTKEKARKTTTTLKNVWPYPQTKETHEYD